MSNPIIDQIKMAIETFQIENSGQDPLQIIVDVEKYDKVKEFYKSMFSKPLTVPIGRMYYYEGVGIIKSKDSKFKGIRT